MQMWYNDWKRKKKLLHFYPKHAYEILILYKRFTILISKIPFTAGCFQKIVNILCFLFLTRKKVCFSKQKVIRDLGEIDYSLLSLLTNCGDAYRWFWLTVIHFPNFEKRKKHIHKYEQPISCVTCPYKFFNKNITIVIIHLFFLFSITHYYFSIMLFHSLIILLPLVSKMLCKE